MIKGLGNDLVNIDRIKNILTKKYSNRFLEKIFTVNEINYCKNRKRMADSLAARWAIKEAFYKALPEDLQKISSWKSIELISNKEKPYINICCGILQKELDRNNIKSIMHSVSHDTNYVTAVVVLS